MLSEGAKKKLAEGKFFSSVIPLANAIEEYMCVGAFEAWVIIGFILVFISSSIHIYCRRLQQIINEYNLSVEKNA